MSRELRQSPPWSEFASLNELRAALFNTSEDYVRIAEVFRDEPTRKSQFVANLPEFIGALQDRDQEKAMQVIRSFKNTDNIEAEAMLIEYVTRHQPQQYAKDPLRDVVIETLVTISSGYTDPILRKVALQYEESEASRRLALEGLKHNNPDLYLETIDVFFAQIDVDSEEDLPISQQNAAYANARVLIGHDAGLTDRVIKSLELPHPTTALVDVLVRSSEPIARKALFEVGLTHPSSAIRRRCMEAIVKSVDGHRPLSPIEEQQIVRIMNVDGLANDEARILIRALAQPHSEEAVRVLIKYIPRHVGAIELITGIDESWDALLEGEGVGEKLLQAQFKTRYYAPPQTYYPDERGIRKEISARVRGIEIMGLGDYADEVKRNQALTLLWREGMEHMTLGETHRLTKSMAAKLILKILKDNGLSYRDEKKMEDLRRAARTSSRDDY